MRDCRLPIADCRFEARPAGPAPVARALSAHSTFGIRHSTFPRRAFTLIEMLVVMGIIILLIGLAVPAFSYISGSTSVEGAENALSAMLGRARATAMVERRRQGVVFFINPATDRVMVAEVIETELPAGGGADVFLDLMTEREFIALPAGIISQSFDSAAYASPGVRADDGYLGFNQALLEFPSYTAVTSYAPVGGVILFDEEGRLCNDTYGFKGIDTVGGQTFFFETIMQDPFGPIVPPFDMVLTGPAAAPIRTQIGVALMNRESLQNQGNLEDAQITGTAYAGAEQQEEVWIDKNAVPLLVNRYNGTLMRGE